MPQINFYVFFITAAFPIILGAIYYNPKVLGKAWLSASGLTAEEAMNGNMTKILLLSYLFGLFVSYIIFLVGTHQAGIYQLFLHEIASGEATPEVKEFVSSFMDSYGTKHRSFGHGALHGMEICLLMGLGLIGISALHEQRSMKYVWIHVIFWVICGGLMGGVLCEFA